MEWALGALVVALLLGRKTAAAVEPSNPTPAPKPTTPPDANGGVSEVLLQHGTKLGAGLATLVGGGGAAAAAKGGAAAAGAATTGTVVGTKTGVTVPAGLSTKGLLLAAGGTVLGVSAGFVVVVGSWAVALVAAIVISAVMAPEMARRGRLPAWLTSSPYGQAWQGGRSMWLELLKRQSDNTYRTKAYRWVAGDGPVGRELNITNELVFLLRPGEAEGPADYFDFYDAIEWAKARKPFGSPPTDRERQLEDAAHLIALTFSKAALKTSRALARQSGQAGATLDDSDEIRSLAAEGVTPLGAGSVIPPSSASAHISLEDHQAAVAAGIEAGLGIARGSYGAGGNWLFEPLSRQAVAEAVFEQLGPMGATAAVAGGVRIGTRTIQMPGGRP